MESPRSDLKGKVFSKRPAGARKGKSKAQAPKKGQ